MVSDIIGGIENQIGISLPEYREVPFILDTKKNPLGAMERGYIVTALGGNQSEGEIKSLTITRQFQVVLTREYYGNQINDTVIFDLMTETLEDAENLYGDMALTNLGVAGVLNIHSLEAGDPDLRQDDKHILIPIIFSVQYRKRI